MASNTISPFAGWPATRQIIDESGSSVFTVTPRVLTPVRAKIADFLSVATTIGLGVEVYLYFHAYPGRPGWYWAAVICGAILAYPLIKAIWRVLLKKQTRMVMTPDEFRIRKWGIWAVYNRHHRHRFSIKHHDLAKAEREQHEFQIRKAQNQGKLIRKRPYYGRSWHVVLEDNDQRRDLLTVFGDREARDIVARLKLCDEIMDTEARKNSGAAMGPEDQWNEEPGDIPETD